MSGIQGKQAGKHLRYDKISKRYTVLDCWSAGPSLVFRKCSRMAHCGRNVFQHWLLMSACQLINAFLRSYTVFQRNTTIFCRQLSVKGYDHEEKPDPVTRKIRLSGDDDEGSTGMVTERRKRYVPRCSSLSLIVKVVADRVCQFARICSVSLFLRPCSHTPSSPNQTCTPSVLDPEGRTWTLEHRR